jgi:hypothetical protein
MADGLRSAYQEPNRLPARFFNLANERAILTAMEAIRISVCRPEQVVVEFTDALQGGFELAIVVQPLFGRRASVGREAGLLWSTPRQDRLTTGTDGATRAMANAAVKQGAAEISAGRAAACLASAGACFIDSSVRMKQHAPQSHKRQLSH